MIKQLSGVVLFLFLSIASTVSSASQTYNKIVAFGDSLSDTGNGIAILQQQFPQLAGLNLPAPFYQNRASDGPVALELLADWIAAEPLQGFFVNPLVGSNYAIISAHAVGDDDSARLIDLNAQIATYLASLSAQSATPDPNALFVVFIGGNDILSVRDASRDQANMVVDSAVAAVQNSIQVLANAGAQHFLVVNLPRVQATPRVRKWAQTDPQVKKNVRRATKRFNRKLRKGLHDVRRQTDVNITEFDLYSFSRLPLKHPQLFGFNDSKQACLNDYDTINLLLGLETISFNPDCGTDGEHIDDFIFFDNLHFTAKTNELIAWGMYLQLAFFNRY